MVALSSRNVAHQRKSCHEEDASEVAKDIVHNGPAVLFVCQSLGWPNKAQKKDDIFVDSTKGGTGELEHREKPPTHQIQEAQRWCQTKFPATIAIIEPINSCRMVVFFGSPANSGNWGMGPNWGTAGPTMFLSFCIRPTILGSNMDQSFRTIPEWRAGY